MGLAIRRCVAWVICSILGLALASVPARAEVPDPAWAIWIDPAGCMNFWSPGGVSGLMIPRRDPATGAPVCLKRSLCLERGSDDLFVGGSSDLSPAASGDLTALFSETSAFEFSVEGPPGASEDGAALARARAEAMADVGRRLGAVVQTVTTSPGQGRVDAFRVICHDW